MAKTEAPAPYRALVGIGVAIREPVGVLSALACLFKGSFVGSLGLGATISGMLLITVGEDGGSGEGATEVSEG